MASKLQPSKQEQPPPTPSRQGPPAPALFHAALAVPLVANQIFLSLPSMQDRVALASTCTALRAYAYAPAPGTGGDGDGRGKAPVLWPNIYLTSHDEDKVSWLTSLLRSGEDGEEVLASQVLRLQLVKKEKYAPVPSYLPRCMLASTSLISADIRLYNYWESLVYDPLIWGLRSRRDSIVDGSEFPATLRHLRLDLKRRFVSKGAQQYQSLELESLTALTSLYVRGAALGSLPPTLRRLDCEAWAGSDTSASEALLQPDALEWIRVVTGERAKEWVAGGEGGGAASGEGLAKFLRHAKHVEIECLVPLDAQFFERLPPTLHTLRLPDLCNGPGLLADGLGRLADRIPGLRHVFLSSGEPVGQDVAGDWQWTWTADDCLEAALALLATPQLHHLDIDELLGSVDPENLPPAICDRFAALPVLPNLCSLMVSLPWLLEVLLDKIPNLQTLYLSMWVDPYYEGDSFEIDLSQLHVQEELATAVAGLPHLTTINILGLKDPPEDPVKYIWGLSPGSTEWGAANPELKAIVEAVQERGLQIKRFWRSKYEEEVFGAPVWDKVEVGQHGPEMPCVDLDALSESERQAWRAENYGPQA